MLNIDVEYWCVFQDDTSLSGNNNALYDFDVNNEEFLCPVCRRPGNSILPILPSDILKSCKRNKVSLLGN